MKIQTSQDLSSIFRYERKFLISELSKKNVDMLVKLHPYLFYEVFSRRQVNNVYFDTFNLQNYYDNVEGSSDRVKVRIRWYGNLFGHIEKPILEIKIKTGLLGTKKLVKLDPFNFSAQTNMSNILKGISDNNIIQNFNLLSLKPTLLNRYLRNYYLSADGNYRITIDEKQSFYKIQDYSNSFLNRVDDNKSVILELKYNKEFDSEVGNITSRFPFRLSKNSKYANGIQGIM